MNHRYKKYLNLLFVISVLFSNTKISELYFNYDLIDSGNTYVKSSVPSSMAMSLIVPGLGQYKQNRKYEALGFFIAELSLIYLQNIYNGKGDDKVSEYKNYADLHWDFEHWILHYEDWNDSESEFYSLFSDPNGNWKQIWSHSHHIGFYVNSELHYTYEDEAFGYNLYDQFIQYGPGFMEEYNVTVIKDHHFYEGIRKYNMFFAGWDDSGQGETQVQSGGYVVAVSPNKNKYNSIWDTSIEFYDYAEYAITGLYLNHLVSMLEIYIRNKFDNRFDLNVSYDYNKYSESINYSLMLSLNLK